MKNVPVGNLAGKEGPKESQAVAIKKHGVWGCSPSLTQGTPLELQATAGTACALCFPVPSPPVSSTAGAHC